MKEVRISEGIQATIEILESIPVKVKDMETTGIAIATAIRNLNSINKTVLAIEEKVFAKQDQEAQESESAELRIVDADDGVEFEAKDVDVVTPESDEGGDRA